MRTAPSTRTDPWPTSGRTRQRDPWPRPVDVPVPPPAPVADEAGIGAFAAAVAAKQARTKKTKAAPGDTTPEAGEAAQAGAAPAAVVVPVTPAALPAAPAPRTFAKKPAKGVERAKITYRQVRISSEPDVVQSVELGRLDRGDEVEILESFQGYLRVRTPDDITGWIVRHTIA